MECICADLSHQYLWFLSHAAFVTFGVSVLSQTFPFPAKYAPWRLVVHAGESSLFRQNAGRALRPDGFSSSGQNLRIGREESGEIAFIAGMGAEELQLPSLILQQAAHGDIAGEGRLQGQPVPAISPWAAC